MSYNGNKTRTWDNTTRNFGSYFNTEFNRIYENTDYLQNRVGDDHVDGFDYKEGSRVRVEDIDYIAVRDIDTGVDGTDFASQISEGAWVDSTVITIRGHVNKYNYKENSRVRVDGIDYIAVRDINTGTDGNDFDSQRDAGAWTIENDNTIYDAPGVYERAGQIFISPSGTKYPQGLQFVVTSSGVGQQASTASTASERFDEDVENGYIELLRTEPPTLQLEDRKSGGTNGGTNATGLWADRRDLTHQVTNELDQTKSGLVYALNYDNLSGMFQQGEQIVGGTSGESAYIVEDNGASTLYLVNVSNPTFNRSTVFQDNEQLTGQTSGATADANGTESLDHSFAVEPGVYDAAASSPFFKTIRFMIRLYDGTVELAKGTSEYTTATTAGVQVHSFLNERIVINSLSRLFIQYTASEQESSNGLGVARSGAGYETYTRLILKKIK